MSEMTWTEARAMARDAAERAQRRREEAAEREAASEQQWEYRVADPTDPHGAIWQTVSACLDFMATIARQAEMTGRPVPPLRIERRPVGDWQPYDPEADR